MAKQKKGLTRNTIDKFYTKENVVLSCLDIVKQHIKPSYENDLIIEPSAGAGAFIKGIKSLSRNALFYDLEPEDNNEIIKQDYLLLDYTTLNKGIGRIHIIGNPPFGRQSSLAIKFIKKSCEFCSSISFILPKSFKKDSLKKSFPLNFHLLNEYDLPEKAFLCNGLEHDVPCVFQIWEKRPCDRPAMEKLEPSGFVFTKRDDNPDISFRRVGVNAGVIDTLKLEEKNIQSHYFIKFTNKKNIQENIQELSKITYVFNNTVGPRSISKQELLGGLAAPLTPRPGKKLLL